MVSELTKTIVIIRTMIATMQGGAKVGLQLRERKTQSLFLYYYLYIAELFSTQTTLNLLLPHPVH